jgi:hypothetical protein
VEFQRKDARRSAHYYFALAAAKAKFIMEEAVYGTPALRFVPATVFLAAGGACTARSKDFWLLFVL